MTLLRAVDFDPGADLARIADLAELWRGLFRPGRLGSLPTALRPQMEALAVAERLRLYLVTRPRRPIALAILDGLDQNDAIDLLALAPSGLGSDEARPLLASPADRRRMVRGEPEASSGRGVFAFLLGGAEGCAWIDLEPEGLVLAMARWGGRNVLDHAPLMAGRLRALARRLAAEPAAAAGDEP
ncbi:hypothetical protein Deba_3265 [Desulfarculus baarsii DSM 2075]|uniref:Uncharacterized protein n=1 Tax=Desulfarculus baarsii (strain ATCC 33931 / DSM 2075 / LMG 7858 / VKM B-1802 / 2st14) TaxID=644282 RepID=E1QM33_DESB2|nr:hypothetical protein [Desulfarculus baarsii]ADK86618.1 hypothetical protein Deba_3265 [Desulfarculus baarsii DSM 2075]